MKIQILHGRDPDSACDITVYVDGTKVDRSTVEVEDIDPGRGWQRADWNERVDEARKVATAEGATDFDRDVFQDLLAYGESKYIESD